MLNKKNESRIVPLGTNYNYRCVQESYFCRIKIYSLVQNPIEPNHF